MTDLGHHIKALNISNNLEQDYNRNTIENLSKVNIFVGSNNSGKSRLLRGIFSFDKNFYFMPTKESVDIKKYYKIMIDFLESLVDCLKRANYLEGIDRITIDFLNDQIGNLKGNPRL
ncbi:hypothetical protein N7983_26035, partial [Priestia megaterium]